MVFSLAVFVFTFLIYIKGVSPSVYGGDSGDIILASWFGGVAHPPGYPLNTMIGWVFTHLPYQATIAFKANLMAAFLMAIAISLLFLILNKLIKNVYVSLASCLVLTFTPLFWLYGHIIEVFQLNIVLIGASLYFLLSWRESVFLKRQKMLFLNLAFLFLGLAVFHHQTSVLIIPSFAFLILKTNKKIIKDTKLLFKLAAFFALGFLPYIFIPFAAFRYTPINWDDPSNLRNFLRLVTRADYGTFVAASNIVGVGIKARLLQFVNYFLFLKADFSIVGLFLIAAGAIYCFLREKVFFYFLLLAIFFAGPFFLFYSSFPLDSDFFIGLWERFVLLSYFLLFIYIGFGIKVIYDFIKSFFIKYVRVPFLSKEALVLLVGASLLLYPLFLAFTNYSKVDLSNFYLGDWLGQDILTSVEPNSLFLVFADTTAFNSQYIFYTSHNPKNIKLVIPGQLKHLEYRKQVMRYYPELKYPDDFLDRDEKDSAKYIASLMHSNVNQFPIFAIDHYPDVAGYKWMTVGLVRKFIKTENYNKDELARVNGQVYKNFKFTDFSNKLGYTQFITSHIEGIYYRSLIELSDEFLINDQENEAFKYLNLAVDLIPDAKEPYIRFGNVYFKNKNCLGAKGNYEKAFSIDSRDWRLADILSSVYGDCLKDDAMARKYKEKAEELKGTSDSLDKF